MPCLIGDVGATNVRFAVATPDRQISLMRSYRTCAYSSLLEAVNHYLNEPNLRNLPRPTRAALAIAAPLLGDEVSLPNRNWTFSRKGLQAALQFEVDFYNDFSAVALAVPHLEAADKKEIGVTEPNFDGAIAVIGPGTGLGVAGLIRRANQWIDLCGEGGHATMAATTREESEILNILRVQWGHVSAERVLSGPGLVNIYKALCIVHSTEARELNAEDITNAMMKSDGHNEQTTILCIKAFNIFCSMLGTVAGNVALTLGATGGVYIAGGILPRFAESFTASSFRTRFEHKGRLNSYMHHIPTYLILHRAPALLGLIHAEPRP